MEVSAEAKRIMVVALGKLYSSRGQRGGLRLHRSLLLTLVMKSARDMYHEAQATAESDAPGCELQDRPARMATELQDAGSPAAAAAAAGQPRTLTREEAVGPCAENKENRCPSGPGQHSRKRRGKAAAEPDFLPCKKAKLEHGNFPQQLLANTALMGYVNCNSEQGGPPTPMPLQRAIAAC